MEDKFRKACDALYSGRGDRTAADRWITEFQKSPEAWEVCCSVLSRDGEVQVQFLAAKTLHVKIKYDYWEQVEDRFGLRDKLLSFMGVYFGHKDRNAVSTQLSLAVATLAIYMDEWPNAIRDLAMKFGDKDTFLIELLQMIPEEHDTSSFITGERKSQLSIELFDCGLDVMQFLEHCMQQHQGSASVQLSIFKCLRAWITLVEIPGKSFCNSCLFSGLFDQLNEASEAFDTLVSVTVSILHSYNVFSEPDHIAVIQAIVPRIFGLVQVWTRAIQEEDIEIAEGIARIFAGMGEAYIGMIFSNEKLDQIRLLELPLLVASHPSSFEVAGCCWFFWIRFLEELLDSNIQEMQAYVQVIQELLKYALRHLVIPPDQQNNLVLEDEFLIHRGDIAEIFDLACLVLGSKPTLHFLNEFLKSNTSSWPPVEACLAALCFVSKRCVDDEILDPIIHSTLKTQTDVPLLRETQTKLFGCYAFHFKKHPQYLEPVLTYILMTVEKSEVIASRTIRLLAEKCAHQLGFAAETLFGVSQSNSMQILMQSRLDILEAVARIVAELEYEDASTAMKHLAPFPALLTQQDHQSTELAIRTLDILYQYGWRKKGEKHPGFDLFVANWDTLFAFTTTRACKDPQLAERICSMFKNCIRAFGTSAFLNLLAPFLKLILESFNLSGGKPPFVYVAGVTIDMFRNETGCHDMFAHVLETMSLKALEYIGHIADTPDLVEDLFNMLGRNVRDLPQLIVPKAFFQPIFQCAVAGLLTEHRAAGEMISLFLEDVLTFGVVTQNNAQVHLTLRPYIEQCVLFHGQLLVTNVIVGISGALPTSRIAKNNDGSLASVLYAVGIFLLNLQQQQHFLLLVGNALEACPHLNAQTKAWLGEKILSPIVQQDIRGLQDLLLEFNHKSKLRLERKQ